MGVNRFVRPNPKQGRGVTRDAGTSGKRRNAPGGPICPTMRPGDFGCRRRRSPLEVSGTAAPLASVRRTNIASVKSVNI
jgi:hypothetical protein